MGRIEEWPTEDAVRALEGEIFRTSARLAQIKRDRKERMVFLAGVVLVALMFALTFWAFDEWAARDVRALSLILLGAMGLTLAFAPLLAYFAEEGRYEREAK